MWLFLTLVTFSAAHPAFQAGDLNATWACDNPTCPMVCRPKCAAPNCTTSCDMGFTCQETPRCQTDCPYTEDGILVSASCPMCSIVCNPLGCTNCTTTCQPVNCDWECFLPNNCPYPRCELQAAAPACQSASGSRAMAGMVAFLSLVVALV